MKAEKSLNFHILINPIITELWINWQQQIKVG
jgi:hypothetical protein